MTAQALMYGKTNFAHADIKSVALHNALGHARIAVALRVQPHPAYATIGPNQRPWDIRLSGWISTERQSHIADLMSTTVLWPTHDHPQAITEQLYGTVSFREIELLHEQRPANEGALQFSVNLIATTLGAAGASMGGILQLPFNLPVSEWRRMLDGCGYAKFLTIEVPLDGVSLAPALQPAATKLREAVEHRSSSRWHEAVAACREVFDAIEAAMQNSEPNVPWSDLADRNTREAMGVHERLRAMRMAMRHPTHLAHHGTTARFAREEANYLLEAACAALKYYNERLR